VRWIRAAAAAAILWAPPAVALAQAASPRGFIGLDRLEHFERVADPAARPEIGRLLGPLLPRSLAGRDLRLRGELREVDDDGRSREFGVRDFRLPAAAGPPLVVRQVLDFDHPRITEQYWALYAGGVRIDCWYFSPYPLRPPAPAAGSRKVLAPYRIERIEPLAGTALVFRTWGSMSRPGDAGWRQGYDFVFSRSGAALRFEYVVRRHHFASRGDDDDGVNVAVERLVRREGERLLELERVTVKPDALTRCGYVDPHTGGAQSRSELERVARCLLAGQKGTVEYRRLDAPSFLERGG
jgi:hypothetical protein